MFCNKCGNKLDDESLFCPYCGAKVKSINDNIDGTTYAENNVPFEIDNGLNETAINYINVNEDISPIRRSNVRRKNKPALLVAIAGIIVVIGIGLFLTLSGKKNSSFDTASQCNLNNNGNLTYNSKSIFCIGKYNDSDDEKSIYSTALNGTGKKLLQSDTNIYRLRVTEDKLYYAGSKDSTITIGCMNLDGSEDTTLISFPDTGDGTVSGMQQYKDKLYFAYAKSIYAVPLTGGEKEKVISSSDSFLIYEGCIYYSANSIVKKYDIKKETEEELFKAKAENLTIYDNSLYYNTDKGLYFYSLKDGGASVQVANSSEIGNYTFYNGQIYFVEKLETSDVTSLARYLADDDSSALLYGLAMINAGEIKRVDPLGGPVEDVESDQILVFGLFSTPEQLYCKISALSDSVTEVELK